MAATPADSPYSGAAGLGAVSVRRLYEPLLLLYLVSMIYLYPYGVFLLEGVSLRPPDVFALACTFLGASAFVYRGRTTGAARDFWPVLPLAGFEIALPILGGLIAGGGIGGISNGLRMVLIWAPMLFLPLFLAEAPSASLRVRIRRIFVVSIFVNLAYGLIQVFVNTGYLPRALLFTSRLERFAVDDHFDLLAGFHASGFFTNTTGLAVFGIVSLAYFLGCHYDTGRRENLVYAALSCALVLITLSRTSLFAMILIAGAYPFFLDFRRSLQYFSYFAAAVAISLVALDRIIGLDVIFSRVEVFLALGAMGALEDSSFQNRIYDTWPTTLAQLPDYPLGTLVSPSDVLGLIDSGYLTYYAQGRWPFVVALVVLLLPLLAGGLRTLVSRSNGARLSLFLLGIFLTAAMIVLIPTRNPLITFMLVYLLWLSAHYRRSAPG